MNKSGKIEGDFTKSYELEWLRYDIPFIEKEVPEKPGVYLLSAPRGHVVYVGKAEKSVRSRLRTYGGRSCHNKWIRTYFGGRATCIAYGIQPADLYFMYRLSEHPAQAEAIAIQQYKVATAGLNQRSEWVPLIHPEDECYKIFSHRIKANLSGDARNRFEQALARDRLAGN